MKKAILISVHLEIVRSLLEVGSSSTCAGRNQRTAIDSTSSSFTVEASAISNVAHSNSDVVTKHAIQSSAVTTDCPGG
jgi:hypothetical protein